MSARKMTIYVLVHSSWHGGWCWQKVLPFLRQDNLAVYTPTLTGWAREAIWPLQPPVCLCISRISSMCWSLRTSPRSFSSVIAQE
jgi:hypothetical protein